MNAMFGPVNVYHFKSITCLCQSKSNRVASGKEAKQQSLNEREEEIELFWLAEVSVSHD